MFRKERSLLICMATMAAMMVEASSDVSKEAAKARSMDVKFHGNAEGAAAPLPQNSLMRRVTPSLSEKKAKVAGVDQAKTKASGEEDRKAGRSSTKDVIKGHIDMEVKQPSLFAGTDYDHTRQVTQESFCTTLSEYIALNTTEPADTIKCEFELVDGTSLLEHSEGAAVQTETGTLYVFKAGHLQRGSADSRQGKDKGSDDSDSIAEPERYPSIRVYFEAGVMEIHSLNDTLNAIHDLGVNGDEMVKMVDKDFCKPLSPLELTLVAGGNGCEDVSSLVTSMFIEKATLEVPADMNAPRVMVDTRASSIKQDEGRNNAAKAKDGEETGGAVTKGAANTGVTEGANTGEETGAGLGPYAKLGPSAANTGVTKGEETGAANTGVTEGERGEAEGGEDDEEISTTTLPGDENIQAQQSLDVDKFNSGFNVNRVDAGAPRGASLGFILQTMLAGFSIVQAASMA